MTSQETEVKTQSQSKKRTPKDGKIQNKKHVSNTPNGKVPDTNMKGDFSNLKKSLYTGNKNDRAIA